MITKKSLTWLGIALAFGLLTACGSNRDSDGGGIVTTTGGQFQAVGSDSCEVCHSVTVAADGWTGSSHDNDAVAGCEGCHGNGGGHRGIGPIPVPAPGLNQCAKCHDVSRHFGDKASTPNVIEGYVFLSCAECHADRNAIPVPIQQLAHNPGPTDIHQEWGVSAHAGHIASATPDTGRVWANRDWDGGSATCQRCHTATGIMNFLNDPVNYNAANNDFSHLAAGQNELLYCWGCHSNVGTGVLRNPGAISEEYNPDNPATVEDEQVLVNYPDIGPSNVCMGCHLGRETGEVIMVDPDVDGVRAFINSHYLTAGATLFNESGYEYAAGGDYDAVGFHKNIGVGDTFGTGTDGPCVTCHMTSVGPHTFTVSAASTSCAACHAGLTDVVLEELAQEFGLALEELNLALQAQGIFFGEAHPYFYTAPFVPGGVNTQFNDWASVYGFAFWKDVMGAAFNYNLFKHDPGAFAHNREYALMLIADSIDFINDGLIDGDGSLAADLLVRGMNVGNEPVYAAIHDGPVAAALVAADTAAAEVVCTGCHAPGPHFNPVVTAQFMGEDIVCANCHAGNNIMANPVVLADYAEAGHADVAGVWSNREFAGSCTRCHTASGYAADLAVPGSTYTYPNAAGSNRLQVLACFACHSDLSTGARQAAPQYTATWSTGTAGTTLISATASFPDAADSNLCIRCHSARRGGPNITDTATTTAHYLPIAAVLFSGTANMVTITANDNVPSVPAVGTMFSGVGYEFAGQVYSGIGAHKNINTGTDGPCVACHMSGAAGHTWEPATKDIDGNFTAVVSTVCVNCHADMDAAHLNASKAAFAAALAPLDSALQAVGIFYNHDDGRFYQEATYTTQVNDAYYGTVATNLGWDASDLAGAAFNFWLFSNDGGDQCAYVHNRGYALRLVADSIDFLNDGLVNGN